MRVRSNPLVLCFVRPAPPKKSHFSNLPPKHCVCAFLHGAQPAIVEPSPPRETASEAPVAAAVQHLADPAAVPPPQRRLSAAIEQLQPQSQPPAFMRDRSRSPSPSPQATNIARRLSLYKLQPVKNEKFSDIQLKPVVRERLAQPLKAAVAEREPPVLKVVMPHMFTCHRLSLFVHLCRVRPELVAHLKLFLSFFPSFYDLKIIPSLSFSMVSFYLQYNRPPQMCPSLFFIPSRPMLTNINAVNVISLFCIAVISLTLILYLSGTFLSFFGNLST